MGCLFVVTSTGIAIKAVPCIIPVDFYFWMRGLNSFNFLSRNMRVELSEVEQHRRRESLLGIICSPASVVANGHCGM